MPVQDIYIYVCVYIYVFISCSDLKNNHLFLGRWRLCNVFSGNYVGKPNISTHLQKRPFLFPDFHDSNNRDGYEWYKTHTPAISNCPSGISVVTVSCLGDLEHSEDYDDLWIKNLIHNSKEYVLIYIYRQTSNIKRAIVGNKIVDHSDVRGTSHVDPGSNYIFILDLAPVFNGLC